MGAALDMTAPGGMGGGRGGRGGGAAHAVGSTRGSATPSRRVGGTVYFVILVFFKILRVPASFSNISVNRGCVSGSEGWRQTSSFS